MGQIARRDFSAGWQADADAINAPANCLLRMDNCVLDERGALTLRPGSAKLNTTVLTHTSTEFNHTAAFETAYLDDEGIAEFTREWERPYVLTASGTPGPATHNFPWEASYIDVEFGTDLDVHSLYATKLGTTEYRMAGADDSVYSNSINIIDSLDGEDDVSFGSHQGQILFARGTSKKKFDGTTVRNWGISAPSAAPTLSALAADSKVFSTCASAESPGMTSNEGIQAFVNDKAGTGNAAVSLTPDATTARATSTKTFAAPTDFTVYDAAQVGTDDDPIQMFAFFTEPQYVDRVVLMIDVNDGTFELDYYYWEFVNGEPTEVLLSDEEYLAADYASEGFDRSEILARLESRPIQSTLRSDKPVSDTGWNLLSVPRGKMNRVGLTAGKNWATVKAVRLVYIATTGGAGALARFDAIQIIGGAQRPLTGTYKGILIGVRNNGTYTAKGVVSSPSAEIGVRANGIRATLDATTVGALDNQITELWLYLMGGRLDRFYRAAVLTGGPFYGAQTLDAISSDRTMLINNIYMETDNAKPPDDIIGIEGPVYDRTLVLTGTSIYPSRRLNPDSYSANEIVTVGNAAEHALWIKKLNDYVYVGTTRDIYRIAGDWTPQPSGVLNIVKRGMGVTLPPISKAVAIGRINNTDTIVYLSSDGWRTIDGTSLMSGMELLWRGKTRHGVLPVNVSSSTARFRCAITKNFLYALTPEGTDTTESSILHAYSFNLSRWYRWSYASSWRSLGVGAEGTLLAGSDDGFVWDLDEPTGFDGESPIDVEVWTSVDGDLFTQKEPQNLSIRVDTGGDDLAIAFHIDGNTHANKTETVAADLVDTTVLDISDVNECRQIQLRMTGSMETFALRGYQLGYFERPLPLKIHDTGYVDLTDSTLAWVRRLNVKARAGSTLTVQPYYGGIAGTPRTVTVSVGKEMVYAVPVGREDKGTTARAIVSSDEPSNVYWVEWEYNVSGKIRQKRVLIGEDRATK